MPVELENDIKSVTNIVVTFHKALLCVALYLKGSLLQTHFALGLQRPADSIGSNVYRNGRCFLESCFLGLCYLHGYLLY